MPTSEDRTRSRSLGKGVSFSLSFSSFSSFSIPLPLPPGRVRTVYHTVYSSTGIREDRPLNLFTLFLQIIHLRSTVQAQAQHAYKNISCLYGLYPKGGCRACYVKDAPCFRHAVLRRPRLFSSAVGCGESRTPSVHYDACMSGSRSISGACSEHSNSLSWLFSNELRSASLSRIGAWKTHSFVLSFLYNNNPFLSWIFNRPLRSPAVQ